VAPNLRHIELHGLPTLPCKVPADAPDERKVCGVTSVAARDGALTSAVESMSREQTRFPALRALLIAATAAMVFASVAAASPVADVLGPDGKPLVATEGGAFAYPAVDGFVLSLGAATVTAAGVDVRDVSLLGGRILVARVVVPSDAGPMRVEGLFVGGRRVVARPNALIPLDAVDYLVTAQTAVAAGGSVGRVGLRLTLSSGGFGVPAGTQVLVGLPAPPPSEHPVGSRALPSPLAVLGFTTAPSANLVDFPPAPFVPGNAGLGDRAAALAERFLGIPYVWGGATPATGFDCSGLVQYVYAQLGVTLTHYTGAQYHEGVPVPASQLLPGDLVFFEPSAAGPQHVGIYIGNGQFVDAPHTGDVVKISSLDDSPYASDYVGAVRPAAP
jgi:cell wall-associated NlpC family hydrolase